MNYTNGCTPLELLENNSEVVKYTVPSLPIRSVKSSQSDFPMLSVVNHWHTDFEFSLVTKGRMSYMVNGQRIEVDKGDMIFVNAYQMHYGFWKQIEECEFICTVFHPSLLKDAEKHISRITGASNIPFLLLHSSNPSEAMIIRQLTKLHELCENCDDDKTLFILSAAYQLCGLLYSYITDYSVPNIKTDRKKLEALHRMTGFIQQNYAEKLSLQKIAESGFISRSVCCAVFQQYLAKTPIQYLNEYRIAKSLTLLSDKELSITEIAEKCGFSSSSYFAETFRRIIGTSPGEYSKNI